MAISRIVTAKELIMTIQRVNHLRQVALQVLLDDTFSYVQNKMRHAYRDLARQNGFHLFAQHTCEFFMYDGDIYPDQTRDGIKTQNVNVFSPPLHPQFFIQFDQIFRTLEDHNYNLIKNLYTAVLSNSHNRMVLKEFLPSTLLGNLQNALGHADFYALDFGTTDRIAMEHENQTRENIQRLKEHYHGAIQKIKELLMERLLLQE